MYKVEYLSYKNRIYAQVKGVLTSSDVRNSVKSMLKMEETFKEEYFNDLKKAEEFLDN